MWLSIKIIIRRGWQRMRRLDSITDSLVMKLGKLREMVRDRDSWHAPDHSQTWLGNWTTTKIKIKKQKSLPSCNWINKFWHIHTIKYYLAIKYKAVIQNNTCTPVLTTALLTIAKTRDNHVHQQMKR